MEDLKYKEIPSNPWEKDPYHHHIWDFAYFYKYEHPYLTYLPQKFLSKFFFWKKYNPELASLSTIFLHPLLREGSQKKKLRKFWHMSNCR